MNHLLKKREALKEFLLHSDVVLVDRWKHSTGSMRAVELINNDKCVRMFLQDFTDSRIRKLRESSEKVDSFFLLLEQFHVDTIIDFLTPWTKLMNSRILVFSSPPV